MRVVLLTNILTPFRIFFYDKLYEEYKKKGIEFNVVVMVPREPGRTWEYEDYKRDYTILLKGVLKKVSGIDLIINTDIAKIIKQLSPNIVICAGSYMLPSVWIAILLKKIYKYKILYWSESHLHEVRNYGKLKLLIRDFFRNNIISKFDGFWYAGKLSKEFLMKYSNSNSYYVFVPNLIDQNDYFRATQKTLEENQKTRALFDLNNDNILMLCPARLSKEKGIIEFLQIIKDCKNKDNVTIVIPGIGNLKEEIETKAKLYNIDLRLIGFQNQNSMINLYSIADVFVLPSLSDPNPLSCIEASWASKPLIVSKHVGNYPEIISEGKNGYVFDYKNHNHSVKIFEKIISSSKSELQEAGNLSLNIARKKYNSDLVVSRVADETLDIIKFNSKVKVYE